MNKFLLSIIFDSHYAEPALITAIDIRNFIPVDFDFTLVYIESTDKKTNAAVGQLINDCIASLTSGRVFKAISLNSDIFKEFSRFHFTSSILYKLSLPTILDYEYIINIDAGFLTGNHISMLFDQFYSALQSKQFLDSAVGALCSDAVNHLSLDLYNYNHTDLYPAAGILFFNKKICVENNFFNRIVYGFNTFKDKLIWAEQDLLCLVLNNTELYNISLHEEVLLEQLSIDGYINNATSIAFTSNFMLYKVTGTLKPWKYWVLDPKKKFYLMRREYILAGIDLKNYDFIIENRSIVTHHRSYAAFMDLQEFNFLNT